MDNTHSRVIEKSYKAFFSPHKHESQQNNIDILNRGKNYMLQYETAELAVTTWGNSGDQVLLMHGWGGARTQMTGFVDPLLAAGYRVVAYDQPAHGESFGEMTNILEITPSMDVVRKEEGDFVGIIAHSFGTLITSHALVNLNFPSPKKLVYLGAFNRLLDAIPRFQILARLPDEIISGVADLIAENFNMELLRNLNNEDLVKKIKIPALVFHDINDEVTPVNDSRVIAQAWETARYVETSKLGHRGALQSPNIHAQIVEFLMAE